MLKRPDVVQRAPSGIRFLVELAKRPPVSNVISDARATLNQLEAIERLTCGFHPLRCKLAMVRETARETMHQEALENSMPQATTMLDLGKKGFEHYVINNEEYPLRWHKPFLLFVQHNGLCRLIEESHQFSIPTGYNVMTGWGPRRRIPASTITIDCNVLEGFTFKPYSGPRGSNINIKDLLIEGGALALAENLYLFEHTPQKRSQHQSPTQTTLAYTVDESLYALFHDVSFEGQHVDRIMKGGFHVIELFEKPLGWTDGIPKRLKTALAMRVTDGSRQGVIRRSSSSYHFEIEPNP